MSKRVVGRDAGKGIHMKSTIVLFKYSITRNTILGDVLGEYYCPQFLDMNEVMDFVDKVQNDHDLKNFEINYPEEKFFGFEVEIGSLKFECSRICNPDPADFVGKEVYSSFPWSKFENLLIENGEKIEKTIDSFEDFLEAIKEAKASLQIEREWI